MFDLGEPDFINDAGIKWWLEKDLTRWAHKPLGKQASPLPKDTRVYLTEFPDGEKMRVVIMDGGPVYEHTSLEDIAVWLDMQKLILIRDANTES